jgi:hypothetical protein
MSREVKQSVPVRANTGTYVPWIVRSLLAVSLVNDQKIPVPFWEAVFRERTRVEKTEQLPQGCGGIPRTQKGRCRAS